MTKALNYFLASLLGSALAFLGMNYLATTLEDFFFWQERQYYTALAAQLNQSFEQEFRPFRNWKVKEYELEAAAGLVVLIDNQGREKVLFEKEAQKKLPIASLTKLMTALVVLDSYDLSRIVEIREVLKEGNGQLRRGEKFEVQDLLSFLLMTSDNEAAHTLAKERGGAEFVLLMNEKARALGMTDTSFVNPTGLDPDSPQEAFNVSTPRDLISLVRVSAESSLLREILSTPEIEIYSRERLIPHRLKNTNELLEERSDVLLGKTGWTPKAKGCLVLITRAPRDQGEIVSVILGSENRFEEMEQLIDWTKKAYLF